MLTYLNFSSITKPKHRAQDMTPLEFGNWVLAKTSDAEASNFEVTSLDVRSSYCLSKIEDARGICLWPSRVLGVISPARGTDTGARALGGTPGCNEIVPPWGFRAAKGRL